MSIDISQLDSATGIVEKEIDGKVYRINLLNTTVGLKVTFELTKLLAPSAGTAFDGMTHDELLNGPSNTFAKFGQLLVDQMGSVDVIEIIKVLLKDLEVDGKRVNFDTHFRAKYGELVLVTQFALEANFSDFFTNTGLKTRLQSLVKGLVKGQEPQESSEQ